MDTADREGLERILKRYGCLEFRLVLSELGAEVTPREDAADGPRCSFCGNGKSEVGDRIIRGPGVNICCHCIELCRMVGERKWPEKI